MKESAKTLHAFIAQGPFRPMREPREIGAPLNPSWTVEGKEEGNVIARVNSQADAFYLSEILNRALRKSFGETE